MRLYQFAVALFAVALVAAPVSAINLTGNPQADGWVFLGNSLTGEAGSGDSVFLEGLTDYSLDVYTTSFFLPATSAEISVTATGGMSPLNNTFYDDAFLGGTYQPGDQIFGIGGVVNGDDTVDTAFLTLDFDNNNGVTPASFPGAGDQVTSQQPSGNSLLTEGDLVWQTGGVVQPPFVWFANFVVKAEVDNPTRTNPSLALPGEVSTPFVAGPFTVIGQRGLASPFRSISVLDPTGPTVFGGQFTATSFQLFYNASAVERAGLGIGELKDEVSVVLSAGRLGFSGLEPGGVAVAFDNVNAQPDPAIIPEPVTPALLLLGGIGLLHRVTHRRPVAE